MQFVNHFIHNCFTYYKTEQINGTPF